MINDITGKILNANKDPNNDTFNTQVNDFFLGIPSTIQQFEMAV